MEEVEKLKTANANLEQRKEELVKELEQVTIVSITYHFKCARQVRHLASESLKKNSKAI